MKTPIRRALTAITASAVLMTSPLHASAATDITPPSLSAPVSADFVVGTVIGTMALDADGWVQATDGISMRATWSATDASGVCGYGTRAEYAAGISDWSLWSSSRSVTRSTTDYDDQFGGGGEKFMGYRVRARDCADNMSESFISFRPVVSQEDGKHFGYGEIGIPTYTGSWSSSSCTCWSGGAVRKTTQAGASVTFTGGRNRTALVMSKGPDRGAAKVYVNGVLKATINTYSSTKLNRAVVWNGVTAFNQVKVVNVGTAGHPRIDLDAVLTS